MRHPVTQNRNGFSLVELLVVIAIIAILIALVLPLGRRGSHEAARRVQCLNNMRQIALASCNYESAHQKFPSVTGLQSFQGIGSADQYSGLVAILPYIEQAKFYDAVTEGGEFNGVKISPCPPLYSNQSAIWKEVEIPEYHCASAAYGNALQTHYGYCIGDQARNITDLKAFSVYSIGDGASNTCMAGEITDAQASDKIPFAINQPEALLEKPAKCWKLVQRSETEWKFRSDVPMNPNGRGGHWADGRAGIALFNTVLPPQSPSAAVGGSEGVDGIYSAGGPHPGIVNVAFFDGSTHSISNNIDAGDSSHPAPTEEEMADGSPSPYGVWGALGTINGGEIVDYSDF